MSTRVAKNGMVDHYVVERELGCGGMATVYLARDRRHGRPVALKVLHPELRASVSADRFLQEIQVTARLTHPHILPLHDSGEAGDMLYFVMPFVEGESLRELLERERPLALETAVRLLREMASALDYAHRHGVVHRDIKPANVLLEDEHAVVADFGIARAVSRAIGPEPDPDGRTTTPTTLPGMILGTPAYMAPEQVVGDPRMDSRADLYSLGLVAYETMAGTHPFGRRAAREMIAAQLSETPRPIEELRTGIPPALAELVMRLLAKEPTERPRSAAEVVRALEKVGGAAPLRRRAAGGGGTAWAGWTARVIGATGGLARSIGRALGAPLGGGEREHRGSGPPASRDAYELYLQGRHFLSRGTADALAHSVELFKRAIAADPAYARAHASLADAYLLLAIFSDRPSSETLPHARDAATRALELDGTLPDAHAALASVRLAFDWDWKGAEREFEQAVALDPNYSFGQMRYGLCLMYEARFDDAVAVLERARALDPLLAATSMNLGRAHLTAGRPQKAIPLLQTAITLNPDLALAHEQLGHALLARGLQSEAVAAFRQAVAVSGARESAHLAYALAAVGERREAQAVLDELLGSEERQYLPPVGIALAHLGLGDPDAAFRWLERAYAEHAAFMDGVPTMPAFAPLHADPRWGHLMERMKWEPPGG